MVLPLWRSLHSINLMLPKEDRRAMLLRIFNDSTPVNNNSIKNQKGSQKQVEIVVDDVDTDVVDASDAVDAIEPPAAIEDDLLKKENLALGQDEQEQVDTRETYTKAGDEEDRFNQTV
jgi:multisite-specific tRNA:(cytosine-C5)-methyltransferase